MSTICLSSNYSTFSLNHQLEYLYDGYDVSSSNGVDYYDNSNALEDQLTKELDDLLLSCEDDTLSTASINPTASIINTTTPLEVVHAIMEALQRSCKHSVKQLEATEQNKLCDLSQYNRTTMKNAGITVKACLDFIDIKFTTTKPHNRSSIKKYLTEKTEIRHYIKVVDESDVILEDKKKNDSTDCTGTTFVIRLHDMENLKTLMKRLSFLKHYNANLNIADLEMIRVERAIDFYGAPHEMRTALFKAVRLSKAENCRFYNENTFPLKGKTGGIFSIFNDFNDVRDGNTIYTNNKDSDHLIRLYFKTTDKGQQLDLKDQCLRFEQNYSGNKLRILNGGAPVRLKDLSNVIKAMSAELKFTKLKDDVFPYFRSGYRDFVKPYGLERESVSADKYRVKKRRDKCGNETRLSRYLETHSEFNQVIAKAQHKLAEKFKVEN
jgi:hypothetical protein